MKFILESEEINDYLKPEKYIDFNHESIRQKANELFASLSDEKEKIRIAFEYVRDEIRHSGDIDSERYTKSASGVLKYKEGICGEILAFSRYIEICRYSCRSVLSTPYSAL